MKTTNKNNKSKFLALLLSVMMFSSMGAAFASCVDDTDSSSSSSSSSSVDSDDTAADRVDNGTIKNSNFDFTTLSDTVKIGTSVTGWTRAVNSATTGSAPSSKSASGVIDTAEDAWSDLTVRNKTDEEIAAMQIADAVAAWDTLTTADKLAFYADWEDRDENDDLDIDEEFEEYKEDSYESFNIDEEDLPAAGMTNPGIAPSDNEDADTQILMIHNNNTIGTAQKYTSSTTVTVAAGTAATFSVWVKTADLKTVDTDKNEQDAVGKGAYISVTQSIGGKALDAYEVKNINTESMDLPAEDNGWKQYTFYLKGSSFADTKFSIVLGLGQSGGSDHLDYVNGYAFFDNIQYEELTRDAYDTATETFDEVYLGAEKADKTVDAYTSTDDTFAMNFYDSDANVNNSGWQNATDQNDYVTSLPSDPTLEDAKVTSTDGSKINDELFAESEATDVLKLYANKAAIAGEIANNKYLNAVYNQYIEDTDDENVFIANDQEILMMLSSKGTAYKWENVYEFEMPENVNYMAISFYVKTSDFGQGTGVTVTLVDEQSSTAFSSINTANLEGVTVNGIEDYYDGWQRCYFFVEKGEDLKGSKQTFHLNFNYGPTSITESMAKTSFEAGFAAFTKFETLEMSSLEYECAETGTYAQKYALVPGEEDKAAGNAGFDTAAGTPSDALDTGLANPQNYKGIYSDSYYVTLPQSGEELDPARRYVNTYENAGLLNRDSFTDLDNDIVNKKSGEAWLEGLKSISGKTDATEIWNAVFGNATQPLFIWNDGADSRSYGYIGTSTTISSAYTAISVRVKTGGGAKASVYLVDMDDETRQSYLTIGDKLTYWYDDNGNIWTGDPTSKDSELAFRLDKKTGLYSADKDWTNYETYKNDKFANLAAYSGYADGADVLYAAENSASHSYHDYTWDRAVYYKRGEVYYTAQEGGTAVRDFTEVTELTPRYADVNSQELAITDIDTEGKWATVTFYIKKGNAAKNYRLEVWSSATRAGAANAANSYVIFDTNNPGTASELYDSLMEEYEDDATTKFESVFSYYDTDKHVRYDEALDVDEVGNLYENSFTASSYEEAIAYMLHETKDGDVTVAYNIFADYSLSDVSVTPAVADTDDDDTDTDDTDTETNGDETNLFMLISSIAVSAALLVAIGGIVGRRLWKFIKKRKAAKARVNVVKKNK